MSSGWVIFPDLATFEEMHTRGKLVLGLPKVSTSHKRLDSSKQQTINVARVRTKKQGVLDGSVAVYIKEEFWPEENLNKLKFLQESQVSDYFYPDD